MAPVPPGERAGNPSTSLPEEEATFNKRTKMKCRE
jgi:hypothetical protein